MRRLLAMTAGIFSVFVFGIFLTGYAGAVPNLSNAQLQTPGTSRTLTLPPEADHSSVISLGTAVDPGTGKKVEGYAIIHYKNQPAKPSKPPRGGNTQCYSFLAQGAKWKTVEPWIVNLSNIDGLSEQFVADNLATDITKWEDATDGILGNGTSGDILGNGSTTNAVLIADTTSPDNNNEVYFADVSSSDAIAVTIVWGIFSGPPFGRELVEWDQVYDDVDYDWSASGEATKMDFENIATHELGHSVGLADLYELSCSEQTMYGYAENGETKKSTLESGDIAGVNALY
ncbi:matrixin family metalloprotease [Candidatus Gottesmanbacteria bacterium]|nr:matrixin family metalloprotease [Candidatus Gottesmanbacteria bacterium]